MHSQALPSAARPGPKILGSLFINLKIVIRHILRDFTYYCFLLSFIHRSDSLFV